MEGFSDEASVARLLQSQENSPTGLNTVLLYEEEFLGDEYDHRTLRVNAELMGFDERGRYPGTVYIDENIDDNVWISFEDGSEFPESDAAQAVLASEELSGVSGEVIGYTVALNLDGHDSDSDVDWGYNPETMS